MPTTPAEHEQQESLASLNLGLGVDPDDHLYRRLTSGAQFLTRDLTPLSYERQIEVAWYLFERNPFAHRLITLMTDLIIGEGASVEVTSDEPKLQEIIDAFWSRNQMDQRLREFYVANALNGELVFPVATNPYSGIPVLGYLDSIQVKAVRPTTDNILVLDQLVLKSTAEARDDTTLPIVREDPATHLLRGEVFFHRINGLPNSLRGRSDLLPLADWLDLYDQFMFAEVERVTLLSSFTWDYTVEGANSDAVIQQKVKKLPRFKPGTVFGHNEKEKLEPKTPDLKANDRSEVARLLRVHIAGAFGFPVSYLGDSGGDAGNRATIEGQSDVLMKTPAARQREFGGFLAQLVRFAIEQALTKNPGLYRDALPSIRRGQAPPFRVEMPEIQAKDIARVGTVLSSVMAAMDTGIANRTVSRNMTIRVIAALVRQLGVRVEPLDIVEEIEAEGEEREAMADLLHAELAKRRNPNPPVPSTEDDEDDPDET